MKSYSPFIWEEQDGGGSAEAGTLVAKVQEFTYLSPATIDFGTIAAGDIIVETRIVIDTVFDDPASFVSIGPVSNPDSLLSTAETDTTKACDYVNDKSLKLNAADQIRLKVSAGTSTQGAGRAIVTCRRA